MKTYQSKIFNLLIICLVCYSMGLAWTVLPTISAVIMKSNKFGINDFQYSMLTFSLVFAGLIFSSIAGVFGRIRGLKPVLISGIFLCFGAMTIYGISFYRIQNLYIFLLIGQLILGLGITSILTSMTAYLSLYLPKASAMVLTAVFACINLGSFSCPIFFNLINSNAWGLNCLIISGLQFVLFFLALFVLPIIKNPYIESENKKSVFKRKFFLFWIFFLVISLYSICELVFSYWGIIYLNTYKNFELQLARYGLSFYWAAVGLGQLTVCWLLKYISPKYIYRILPILLALGFWGMFFTSSLTNIIISFVIGGLGASAFIALTLNFVEYDFKEIAEIVSGIMFMGYFLGYIVGSVIIGQIIKVINLSKIFFLIGLVAIIIEIITLYLVRKSRIPKGYH